jgi:hypothetical protein
MWIGKRNASLAWVLPTDRWECGWGVWCDRPTVFAACQITLHHHLLKLNQKMQFFVTYSIKLNCI